MDLHKAIDIARLYLYETYLTPRSRKPVEAYILCRRLQYLLCGAFDRMDKASGKFGCVTPHDIIMLVEAWIIAQGTLTPISQPLELDPCFKKSD